MNWKDTKFASFSQKEIERLVNIYYKEFVTYHLEVLDWDVLEVLELGTFRPKKSALIKQIRAYFFLRRDYKQRGYSDASRMQIEATLKKYIKQYWMIRNGNETRKKFGIKKML